jgi:hypothetical protein
MVMENSPRACKGVTRGLFGLREWTWAGMLESDDLKDLDWIREANL